MSDDERVKAAIENLEENNILSKKEFQEMMPDFLRPHMNYMGQDVGSSRKLNQFSSLVYAIFSVLVFQRFGWAGFIGFFLFVHALDFILWYLGGGNQ